MDTIDEIVAPPDEIEVRPWWQSKLNLGVLAVAIALLCGALGWLVGNNRAIPDPNLVDVGFLQDMRTHHEQAVNLGLYYLELQGTNADLRVIAREIVFGQSIEIGRMIQLLRIYGATETSLVDGVALDFQEWSRYPTGRTFGAAGAEPAKAAISSAAAREIPPRLWRGARVGSDM